MDAETVWMDQMEWKEEKRRGFNIELMRNWSIPIGYALPCAVARCDDFAKSSREIGDVNENCGVIIDLCEYHDSDEIAFEIYNKGQTE